VEIQDRPSDYPIPVRRVGFSGVLRRITIKSPEGRVQLTARIDLYVEVSPDRKGAHLSRNIDAINLLERIPEESWSLEGFAEALHKELLELHPYSSSAVVKLKTTYWVPAGFLDIKGLEPVSVRISVSGGKERKTYSTSVTVKGLTVCPSAQTTTSQLLGQGGLTPSHVQKVLLKGNVRSERLSVLRIEEMATCLWASLSAPSFTLLKRLQEGELILAAFRNPKFAEDVVREAVARLWCRFKDVLPPSSTIMAEVLSLESIHPQDVYAMAAGTPQDLAGIDCAPLACKRGVNEVKAY